MADLGLFDIVALAKAGYKKKDIDNIIAGAGDNPPKPDDNNVPDNKVPDNGTEPPKEPDNNNPDQGDGDNKPEPEDNKDYKTLYEELQKSSADMQSQIKELQSKINSKDNSGSAGKDTTMDDLMSSFKNFS